MHDSWHAILPDSTTLEEGALAIGGCRLDLLAERFGTPLYVYDEATLRRQARRIRKAFAPLGARVSFASKACSTVGVLRVFNEEGLGLDVVSGGEIEAGLRAGFTASRLHLHGNCKTDAELDTAIRLEVHAIVLDNIDELIRLERSCDAHHATVRAMIRITLPLEAETHPHLQTSGRRSKFGLFHGSAEEREVIGRLRASQFLQLVGVHVHLGSQIHDATIYGRAGAELVDMAMELKGRGFPIEEVSVGGGWAVPYRPGDTALSPEMVAKRLAGAFRTHSCVRPAVEPGRALVARAGVAVYRTASVKQCGDHRLIAVDGGMGDNPRPALYGAQYHALVPLRASDPPAGTCDMVGRYCESGDVLVRDVPLPRVEPGDLLCVPVSGAYQVSMASSYNLVPQPAVIMVADGHARLLARRASIDDMLAREVVDEL